jgi:two-component system phosphate regulon response regulator OmpR
MPPARHLLVVDDDERIRGLLQKFLQRQGFAVTTARDAGQARALMAGLVFDLIVLDVMLPGEDGVALTRSLRAAGNRAPVLLLTARGETTHRIEGLEAGADDYLAKPFEPRELVLRIGAVLRRSDALPPAPAPAPGAARLRIGAFSFDPGAGTLAGDAGAPRLTAAEAALLRALAARPGETLARADLVAALAREGGEAPSARAVDVQITRLRRKLGDDPRAPRLLHTVRGEGYRLDPA